MGIVGANGNGAASGRARRRAGACCRAILLVGALLAAAACRSAPESSSYSESSSYPESSSYEVPSGTTLAAGAYEVAADSKLRLLYLSAEDCAPCRTYERREFPEWLRSEAAKHVEFRKLDFYTFRDTQTDRGWPRDLRWVREKTYVRKVTPRFVVLVDRQVVSNRTGRLGGWRRTVALVDALIERKTGRRKAGRQKAGS